MNPIGTIIKREYLSRVKKRTFIIMTILGPLLFAALMVVPVLLTMIEDKEEKTIYVIDNSFVFENKFKNSELLKFVYNPETKLDSAISWMEKGDFYGVLHIPSSIVETSKAKAKFYSTKQPSMALQMEFMSDMEAWLKDIKLHKKGSELGIDKKTFEDIIDRINVQVTLETEVVKDGERKQTSTDFAMILGYIAGFLIYMFVFMYGAQVMRGVIEEKSNRIVEVIVSSVKPFQLMMGKIIGIAMVGLTQFVLWIFLTLGLVTVANLVLADQLKTFQQNPDTVQFTTSSPQIGDVSTTGEMQAKIQEFFHGIETVDIPIILFAFILYFLLGYLLYASMFAAIGSAVDNEADTQQFMLPISLPLILGLVIMFNVISNPEGPLAFWASMIPFTSPIVMMARMPFGVPGWQILVSLVILLFSFIGMVWVSGRIYRTGILMYGKKVNYKELWKWIRFKG